MFTPLSQVPNPTDEQRHEMLLSSLTSAGRPEDYENIIRLLSPPPDITNYASFGELKGVRIGVIGGGLAGLSAAYELRKLGADITILDALEDRIGGRVYTQYFEQDKTYYGEYGAMRIPVSHETVWHYINRFKLNTISMTSPVRNNFLYVHNTRLRTSDSITDILYPKYDLTEYERNLPWPELSEYAFNYVLKLLSPQTRTELLSILPNYSEEYISIMNMSNRKAFEDLGLSQEAISLISGVNPTTGALLNISYDETLQGEYSQDYRNLYRIEGGNVNLPAAFYQSMVSDNPSQYYDIPVDLLGNIEFKAGHYVNGIYKSDNKVMLKYKTRRDSKEEEEDTFDYVICTIPFSTLREVEIKPYFSNIIMQAILELNYIDAQKTLFLCNTRFWEQNAYYGNIIGGISFTDLLIQSIIYPSDHNICPDPSLCLPEEPGVLLASYNLNLNATRLGGQDEISRFEVIKNNVEEVHGLPRGFLDSIVEKYGTVHWNSEPDFRGGMALLLPSQKKLFSYPMLQPEYENRVFFAGEHTSNKHGWIQGALQSGLYAANNLAYHVHQK